MIEVIINGDKFSFNPSGSWTLKEGVSPSFKGKEEKEIPFTKYRELFDTAQKQGYTIDDFRKIRLISEDAKIVLSAKKERKPSKKSDEDGVKPKKQVTQKKGMRLLFG
jgi:hypothetical protein